MRPNNRDPKQVANAVAFVDTVMEHVAEENADQAEFSAEETRWARGVRHQVDAQLEALRRQLKPKHPPAVPAEIRELDREGLLARLESLKQHPGVRYAHLDLSVLTTEDLQRMVTAILEPPRDDEPSP
jgi:hypothetical protein